MVVGARSRVLMSSNCKYKPKRANWSQEQAIESQRPPSVTHSLQTMPPTENLVFKAQAHGVYISSENYHSCSSMTNKNSDIDIGV